jgi:hypothetical protein
MLAVIPRCSAGYGRCVACRPHIQVLAAATLPLVFADRQFLSFNRTDQLSLTGLDAARRKQQAAHDEQVVREILAGCRAERRRLTARSGHERWYLTSLLVVVLQALGKFFFRL